MGVERIEEINVMKIEDMPPIAREEIMTKVADIKKTKADFNFKGFVEIKIVSASPMRVKSAEPIEGTDIDWVRSHNSEIDMSNMF